MGLFDKKFCDVCGEKIGMLGNRKLEDGNLCKDCAKKLSPWFDDRRHSTLEEIKSQLQMREENRSLVSSFRPGRVIRSDRYNLYIDERQQLFAASVNLDREDNPDIISLSQITGCNLDVDEMRTEEYRTDRDGERESYNPPRYSYSYDYYFYIYLNHPYIHEMKLKLNSMDISEDDRNRRHDVERAGQEMMSYLQNVTGCTVGGMGMNQGMGMQPAMGMNNQGMSQNVNPQGGMGTAAGGMGAAAGAAAGAAFAGNAAEGPWVCQSCGATNVGRFCESCGSPRK